MTSTAGTIPDTAVQPLHTFIDQNEFVWRHEQGTLIEMENETAVLKRLNERRYLYQCWPIAPIPGLKTSFVKPWLFLIKTPNSAEDVAFPSQTDRFTIDMEARVERSDGIFSLLHLPASRIQNPYEDHPSFEGTNIQKCAAFKVDVPRSWKTQEGDHVELDLMANFQVAPAIDDFTSIAMDEKKCQLMAIRWDTFSLTFEAELAALRYFVEDKRIQTKGPSHKAQRAFKMIQNFYGYGVWKDHYDLHEEFPHLKNPTHPFHRIPKVLLDRFKSFNADHRAAYDGLTRIPNGLYFVNGCPGAGKTEWNMVLAGLIHSKRRPKSKKRHSPILFLVDLNSTADDAANRYYKLCQDAGMKTRVVRMHGWPYEMRNSGKLNKSVSADKSGESTADFTKSFLTTAGLARHTKLGRNTNRVPTLDEEAWEYFELHQDDGFPALKKLLGRMESGDAFSSEDWKLLRNLVSMLYRAVLAQTDFVATTPVAAYGSFSKLFRPDVVFVDEAPHARELTTLIPMAYFDPVAWIFTGDVNQTRPFVKSDNRADVKRDGLKFNPYAEQLRCSTMARAAAVDAINSKLLVNNRAHGNLHRLPSKIFYQGEMISGHDASAMYPASTLHLKRYLEGLGTGNDIQENRVVVRVADGCEETRRSSFWNPAHHKWLVEQVEILLRDTDFRSIANAENPGTIMIETPYSTAFRQYQAEVKQWPREWQDRVQVLTVDKAQGNQADVVFLDMVRSTGPGFMDDPQRLNVAITRARQAEVIIMDPRMGWRGWGKRPVRTKYTSQIWIDAMAGRRVINIL